MDQDQRVVISIELFNMLVGHAGNGVHKHVAHIFKEAEKPGAVITLEKAIEDHEKSKKPPKEEIKRQPEVKEPKK